jgi:hypothetical protein
MVIFAGDMFVDKREQLNKIADMCLMNEVIRAVFDLKGAGTGFLGITDKRLIFYDRNFFKGEKAMVSLPYDRIACIASEDDKGMFIKPGFFASDKLFIYPQGLEPRVFEFRGADKAHLAHNIIMEYMVA